MTSERRLYQSHTSGYVVTEYGSEIARPGRSSQRTVVYKKHAASFTEQYHWRIHGQRLGHMVSMSI